MTGASTRGNAWCRAPTLSSWTSSEHRGHSALQPTENAIGCVWGDDGVAEHSISFFLRRCQGCFNITTVFSHSQSVCLCGSCSAVLCTPTGGKARLTEGEQRTIVFMAIIHVLDGSNEENRSKILTWESYEYSLHD